MDACANTFASNSMPFVRIYGQERTCRLSIVCFVCFYEKQKTYFQIGRFDFIEKRIIWVPSRSDVMVNSLSLSRRVDYIFAVTFIWNTNITTFLQQLMCNGHCAEAANVLDKIPPQLICALTPKYSTKEKKSKYQARINTRKHKLCVRLFLEAIFLLLLLSSLSSSLCTFISFRLRRRRAAVINSHITYSNIY